MSNGIRYDFGREKMYWHKQINVYVFRTKLTRDMEEIVKCGEGTRTIAFPRSVQRMSKQAFSYNRSLASVVINDGLRELKRDCID